MRKIKKTEIEVYEDKFFDSFYKCSDKEFKRAIKRLNKIWDEGETIEEIRNKKTFNGK